MAHVIVGCGGLSAELTDVYLATFALQSTAAKRDLVYWSESPEPPPDGHAFRAPTEADHAIVAIGDNRARRRLMTELRVGAWFQVLARTSIYRGDAIGDGTYVADRCILARRTRVGRGCLVNFGTVVGHDVVLDDFAGTGPLVNLLGGVLIDEGAFVGASAVVLPGVTVGAWAVVGAGAVVTKNVPAGETWVGNPARRLER